MENRNYPRRCRNSNQLEGTAGVNPRCRRRCIRDDEGTAGENVNNRNCRRDDILADTLADTFNQGYRDGYNDGFTDGRDQGFVEGYRQGVRAANIMARQAVLNAVCRRRCCCRRSWC